METVEKWDYDADVVVLGAGTAGLPAAITARELGCKVVLLEALTSCGGSLNMISGAVAFAGTDEQKAAGIDDSPELLYRDMVNIAGAVPELARAYADNQLEAYKILKEEGVRWPGLVRLPGHSRIRAFGWIKGHGPKLVKAFENRARRSGVEILFGHRATRLIVHRLTGRVIGVKVDANGEIKNFKAKKAVIIATGGFGRNKEMIAEYAPHMVNCIPMMPGSHVGDGHKMAMALGAATKDIGIAVAPSWPVCVETHSPCIWALDHGGIMVNVYGKRFHNESSMEGYYGPMTGAGMQQPGGVYWVVFDEKILRDIGREEDSPYVCEDHVKDVKRCKLYIADTIEELAWKAGIDQQGLKETIDKYNHDIETVGYDTVFGRKHQFGPWRPLVKIDTPPFYAVKCVTSMTSMKGGLRINAKAQVLNWFNEPIPGLYAAGEVTGGLQGSNTYLLATMVPLSMTLGIIAGKNAAKEPSCE